MVRHKALINAPTSRDLRMEAAVLTQLNHKNIVEIVGVCSKGVNFGRSFYLFQEVAQYAAKSSKAQRTQHPPWACVVDCS